MTVMYSDNDKLFWIRHRYLRFYKNIHTESILFTHQQMYCLLNLESFKIYTRSVLKHNLSQALYKLPDEGQRPKHVGAIFVWILV
jgi:hypothetical protein